MRPGIFISGQSINPSVGQSVHGSNFRKNERKIDIYNQTSDQAIVQSIQAA